MSRSSMVHAAKQTIPSRFELICTAAKLARLIHVSTRERMADTINRALFKISRLERLTENEYGACIGAPHRITAQTPQTASHRELSPTETMEVR